MTCGVALLLEGTAVRLVLAFRSIEVMKEFRVGCRYARCDPDVVPRLAGRAGAIRFRWSHRRQRRARDDDFCAVNHLFPPEGRFDEYRRCRSHRIFH